MGFGQMVENPFWFDGAIKSSVLKISSSMESMVCEFTLQSLTVIVETSNFKKKRG
jgi:hypothetical protein